MIFCVYRNKFSAKFRSKKVVYLKHKIKKVMLVFPAAALTIVIYIFLHEIGHLIVMVSAGATITDFSILTAHVYLFAWIFLPFAYVTVMFRRQMTSQNFWISSPGIITRCW